MNRADGDRDHPDTGWDQAAFFHLRADASPPEQVEADIPIVTHRVRTLRRRPSAPSRAQQDEKLLRGKPIVTAVVAFVVASVLVGAVVWGAPGQQPRQSPRADAPRTVSAKPMVSVSAFVDATPSSSATATPPAPQPTFTSGQPRINLVVPPTLVFNNIGVTNDDNTSVGNWDGGGGSFSSQALASAGVTSGGVLSHGGLAFTWPSTAGTGSPDNAIAVGQTITMSGSGKLGFLVSASYGPVSGTGTVQYTDGSSSTYILGSQDWFSSSGPAGVDMVASSTYQNRHDNTRFNLGGYVFCVSVDLALGKTVSSVILPAAGSAPVVAGTPTLHVFAIATSS